MDTTPLRDAYRALLDAADAVGDGTSPPPGEWNARQILAHVTLVTSATTAAATAVAAGTNTTYDNRIALDTWTIDRVVALAGADLRERVRAQAEALCAFGGAALSESELDTPVPTRLLSGGTCLLDGVLPLRDLIGGLAEVELPGHTKQLLALAG